MSEKIPERCPPNAKAVGGGDTKHETIKPKNKPKAPEKSAEKLPPKSERQQKLEERFKGTAWKVVKVDTTPTYRLVTETEKNIYANLSDVAAEKKGLKRIYNEKGGLIATEIVETTDHKVTVELGGKEFNAKLPIEVRQYMKSLGFTGPHITLSNVLIDGDGSADVAKMNIHVSDRDYHGKPTEELEGICKNAIAMEKGILTPKALQNMEKAAIAWYSQQTAVHLDDTSIGNERKKASDAYQEGVEEDIERMSDKWVTIGKKGFIDGSEDLSRVSKIHDENGHGIIWSNIANSHFYNNSQAVVDGLERQSGIINYSLRVYVNLADGNIGKVILSKSKKNEAGLIPSEENMQVAESVELTKRYAGKSMSDQELLWMKNGLKNVIDKVPAEEREKQEKKDSEARARKEAEDNSAREAGNREDERKQGVFNNWLQIIGKSPLLKLGERENLTAGRIDKNSEKYGFIYGFRKLDYGDKAVHFTLEVELDGKGGFKKFELRVKKDSLISLDGDVERISQPGTEKLNAMFAGRAIYKLKIEALSDISDVLDNISDDIVNNRMH